MNIRHSSLRPVLVTVVVLALAGSSTAKLIGWVTGVPTSGSTRHLNLTLDGAIQGWVTNTSFWPNAIGNDTVPVLSVTFYGNGRLLGSTVAGNLFYNDNNAVPGAPNTFPAAFTLFIHDSLLDGTTVQLTMMVQEAGGMKQQWTLGNANVTVSLTPRTSPYMPRTDTSCLGTAMCASKGDALSYGSPWYEVSQGFSNDFNGSLFEAWNCSSPVGFNHIERLNIIPYEPLDAGGRFHHPGFSKDSLHLSEDDFDKGPVIQFSASRSGHPYGRTASVWSLKKAKFDTTIDRWQIFDQLDNPSCSYGLSSEAGTDGVNTIMNDGNALAWGPSATVSGSDSKCLIPHVSNISVNSDGPPSFPLVGKGPLGISTIQALRQPSGKGVSGHCIHMNPKLGDFSPSGVPGSMWAYLWSNKPDQGCLLPDGRTLPAGYYRYIPDKDMGWQLDLEFGPATVNQTRCQAMKKAWGSPSDLYVYSCWDTSPGDVAPSTVYMLNTSWPQPRHGHPLLSCYGLPSDHVHLGEATGNATHLYFLVTRDSQVQRASHTGEMFEKDIYFASIKH